MMFNQERFDAIWRELGLVAPAGLFEELRERYSEPHRAYHTGRHIEECLAALDLARQECERPAEIELALWFHDAIYDTRAHDNEQRSADWAARALESAGAPAAVVSAVTALIMVTRHQAVPSGHDEQILTDIDLAILGANRERFFEYEAQVRIEYSWVPDAIFQHERAKSCAPSWRAPASIQPRSSANGSKHPRGRTSPSRSRDWVKT
jgi:predicted metal-dependent HD superfamily phosphohydrolase